MRYMRLMGSFLRVSAQGEMAYRLNFFISLLYSLLNLATGVLGIAVLFGQVKALHGWTFASTLALLGVYQALGALRGVVIGPSLDALAGLGGDIWTGRFDFTILRPINTQFLASFSRWRLFSLVDLLLALGILTGAVLQLHKALTIWQIAAFLLAICAGVAVLYAVLLIFAALVFWSPGFLFTWLFDSFFDMARYPVGLYPGWVRLLLTWIVPVGVMTTIPAQALNGDLPILTLAGGVVLAAALVTGASVLFHFGLRRYASASS